jgi:glycosyltransferase involved in cell wall biosynthesis
MLHQLRTAGCKVDVIAPLNRNFRYLYVPHKLIFGAFRRRFHIDAEPLALRSYRDEITSRLEHSDADVVFTPQSVPVTLLDCRLPIIIWTDAVFDAMIDYYESYSRLAPQTIANGHQQEQLALNRATLAIYSSEWAAGTAKHHYRADGEKIKVIPFGPNVEVNHDRPRMPAIVKARQKDRCRLLFLGVEWRRKGGDLALETARLLNQAGLPTSLTVVGCDPFRRSERPPYVENLGYVNKNTDAGRETLKQLLSTSHFLIHPARAEASAIAFCEASAFGLPCITTDTGGIATYIRNGVNGVRLGLDATAEQYANVISNLFRDRDRYEEMSMAAFQEYETRLNWRVGVNSLIALLEECLRLPRNHDQKSCAAEASIG